ncbi:TonB family protein [candidate division KSB1 bacterium]
MLLKTDKNILKKRFTVAKRSPKHPMVDQRDKDSWYFQISLISVLLFMIIVALTFNGNSDKKEIPFVPLDYILSVEQIPETRQVTKLSPPPNRPIIPVESDILEELIEDVEWEIETFNFAKTVTMPTMGIGPVSTVAVSPRLIVEKLPQYPESEKKKGKEGIVELRILVDVKGNVKEVEVVKNTTDSEVLVNIAVKTAKEGKYQPARDKFNKPIEVWTSRVVTFSLSNIKVKEK